MPAGSLPTPNVRTRALGVWIAAALVAGAVAALSAGGEAAPVRATTGLPPVHVTTPSIPPITVPGLGLPPIAVPQVDVQTQIDVPVPTIPPEVKGPIVDIVGRAGSPVDIDRTGLWLIDADTGRAQVLFNGMTLNEVAFSPDGRSAVVMTYSGARRHGADPLTMWVVDLASGVRRVLTGPTHGLGGPSWSPDGRWIAYNDYWVDEEPGPQYVDALWVVHPDGSGRRRVAGTDQYGGHYSWSPDSRSVTASLYNDDRVLVAGVADGTEHRFPATNPAWAEWSPTADQLAVSTNYDGPLSIMDPTTGASHVIAADLWNPRWSPDGQWIAAAGDDPSDGSFLLHPDGSGRRHVTDKDVWDWSADGRYLLLGSYGQGQSVLDLQTDQERVISNRPAPGLDWLSDRFVPGTHRAAMLVFPGSG